MSAFFKASLVNASDTSNKRLAAIKVDSSNTKGGKLPKFYWIQRVT